MDDLKNVENHFQNIMLENREKLTLTGIKDVFSFDDQIIIIETELGILSIKGNNLKINKLNLDSADFVVEGKVDSLTYSNSNINNKKENSFISKIFK